MKIAVYVLELNGVWSARVSLDSRIDAEWWSGKLQGAALKRSEGVGSMVMLSYSMPLGWAMKLRDSFKYRSGMEKWGAERWRQYVHAVLEEEITAEREIGRVKTKSEEMWEDSGGRGLSGVKSEECGTMRSGQRWEGSGEKSLLGIKIGECGGMRSERRWEDEGGGSLTGIKSGGWCALSDAASTLAELMSGRSLLEPELLALLGERCPELSEHWRSAAQLAHLEGRLKLEAAVEAPRTAGARHMGGQHHPGAGPRGQTRTLAAWLPRWRLPWRGAARRRALPRCQRCGSAVTARTACAACGLAACAYCEACLALGRSRACALLLRSAALPAAVLRSTAATAPTAARRWGLSAAQAEAAGVALGFMAEPRERSAGLCPERFLLWAVTGAGKTEMIFPLLEAVLAAGGRALVATPRRDVVLELAPRLAKAFPAESVAVLYGGSPDRWIGGRLTLATTHQLLRFHQGFDLVIIDELDAFPYHNDPMLAYAAEQACKQDGIFLYLSATPPDNLQQEARRGRLAHARVPVRFHGHPLPQPKHLPMPPIHVCIKRGSLPRQFIQLLRDSLGRQAQIFIFVSRIAYIEKLLPLLHRSFPGVPITGTSSQDSERADKVNDFRSRTISMLVTTTILERGVTIPRSDVYIMDADSSLFDEASLVQMAGRAGRSKEDPEGIVVFASPQWTRSQRGAISQIRTMNKIALQKGYIRMELRK